jgi:GTP-binding protein
VRPATPSPAFSAAEIEAGRRLFAGEWKFIAAAGCLAALPPAPGLEIAFAGRSNVGKSSLLNALTGRHALARTSRTPGRTQQLILFGGPPDLTLVDMPGYGYAAAGKSKAVAWSKLVQEYLLARVSLARVYLLVDSRHGLRPADEATLATLSDAAVSHQIVLTKCDEIDDEVLAQRVNTIASAIARKPAAFPELLATSARGGQGIEQMRAAIARLVGERRNINAASKISSHRPEP